MIDVNVIEIEDEVIDPSYRTLFVSDLLSHQNRREGTVVPRGVVQERPDVLADGTVLESV